MVDIYKVENRGKLFTISTFAPYLGAALRPIVRRVRLTGSWLAMALWVASVFDAILIILSIPFIHESYASVLLARKAKRLRDATGIKYTTEFE